MQNATRTGNVENTWRNRSCQQAALTAEQVRGSSVAPWQWFTGTTGRLRPSPKRKVNKMVERIKVTWLSLCFRLHPETNLTDTTQVTNKISNRMDFITTSAVEWFCNIRSSPRSVVCANEQTWRPFCTSLRRQHSSATRSENAAKRTHCQSVSDKETYRFLLFFHPSRHLWHCSVDRGIFMQVWQILAAEDGQRLTSIQRPRPKRQFTHFYDKRGSIYLFDLLGITAVLPRDLMDETVQ